MSNDLSAGSGHIFQSQFTLSAFHVIAGIVSYKVVTNIIGHILTFQMSVSLFRNNMSLITYSKGL